MNIDPRMWPIEINGVVVSNPNQGILELYISGVSGTPIRMNSMDFCRLLTFCRVINKVIYEP